ncbi:MAG: hypothetical protein MZW92_75465 [Comamonadaceae bacterium]|nr:hypothetical protein [Comamonadaceae bacterium]
MDELNAARGAGTVVWVCSGEASCTPEAVPSYATNPVTTSGIAHTPGLAGNILAGADLRVSLAGDFGNSGLAAAAGDLVLTGANLANQPAATLLAGQDLALTLSGGLANEQGAQIVSGRDMRLSVAGAVTNSAATIESGRDLAIDAGSISNAAAGRSSRQFVYYVNTPADYQHDKYLTLEAFTIGIEGLIGDAATRNKLIYGESLADYKNYEGSHRIRLNGPTDFYIDSGQSEPRFTLTLTGYEHPAFISAARNGTLNIGRRSGQHRQCHRVPATTSRYVLQASATRPPPMSLSCGSPRGNGPNTRPSRRRQARCGRRARSRSAPVVR